MEGIRGVAAVRNIAQFDGRRLWTRRFSKQNENAFDTWVAVIANGEICAPRGEFSLDGGAGLEFYRKERRSAGLQFEVVNLTNHVNVINFASLFSGTAVAPPRSAAVRLRFNF